MKIDFQWGEFFLVIVILGFSLLWGYDVQPREKRLEHQVDSLKKVTLRHKERADAIMLRMHIATEAHTPIDTVMKWIDDYNLQQ